MEINEKGACFICPVHGLILIEPLLQIYGDNPIEAHRRIFGCASPIDVHAIEENF
jgi:hypothetical protein